MPKQRKCDDREDDDDRQKHRGHPVPLNEIQRGGQHRHRPECCHNYTSVRKRNGHSASLLPNLPSLIPQDNNCGRSTGRSLEKTDRTHREGVARPLEELHLLA